MKSYVSVTEILGDSEWGRNNPKEMMRRNFPKPIKDIKL